MKDDRERLEARSESRDLNLGTNMQDQSKFTNDDLRITRLF